MGRTPAPSIDVTSVIPELAGYARTTFRLHPRAGQPEVTDSSVGGPLLWPADEPWPTAPLLSSVHSPLVSVLQIYARDVPDLPFPGATDVFQFLWCVNSGSEPKAVWRRAADVTKVLASQPRPVYNDSSFFADYDPMPCVLHPERVTEYPDISDLPGDLRELVQQSVLGDDRDEEDSDYGDYEPGPYRLELSVAPGTKALGWPAWSAMDPWTPACGTCGRNMTYLITIDSQESDEDNRWRAADLPDQFPRNFAPHGMMIGDAGSMLLYTCLACPDRPVATFAQFG